MSRPRLRIVPCTIVDACAVVARLHRHHEPPLRGLFALAVVDEFGALRGVAIVGRPVARALDDGWTMEVIRVATDGCDNACSALYGACRRGAIELGYRGGLTYTLASETGASLRGAGWRLAAEVKGRDWSCPSRPRTTPNLGDKLRWEWGTIGGAGEHPTRGLAKAEDEGQIRLFGGGAA